MVSVVVPAMFVTIARSRPRRALKRLDLPTFGFPRTAIWTPFDIRRP